MKIINLTQHPASTEQIDVGVIDMSGVNLTTLKELLTFKDLPKEGEIRRRAEEIAELARHVSSDFEAAMIGGAPFFMSALEESLRARGITPLYAFTKRTCREENGIKNSIFKHEGFIEAINFR